MLQVPLLSVSGLFSLEKSNLNILKLKRVYVYIVRGYVPKLERCIFGCMLTHFIIPYGIFFPYFKRAINSLHKKKLYMYIVSLEIIVFVDFILYRVLNNYYY